MRASRLISILLLIQMRGRISAPALARELEVSLRTIYRDIDALSAAGVPLYAELGRNGGVSLHKGWRTRLTGLTAGESAALPLAGLPGAARALGLTAEAAAAQLKLMASLPADAGASAQRIAARFHMDPVPWFHRPDAPECLPALAQAVWDDRRVRIAYESWNGPVTREIDPLGLTHKAGVWYLVAAVGGSPRTYRVSNIRELGVLETVAERPPRFDLARYWAAWSQDFEARLMGDRARLRISPEGRRILRAVSPAAAEVAAATERPASPPGWVEAEIPIETFDYAARQLLRLGAEVEVLAPAALREAIVREARAVLSIYGG